MRTIRTTDTKTATVEDTTEQVPVYAGISEAERYQWARLNGRVMRLIASRHRAALSTVSDVLHGKLISYGPSRPGYHKDTKARRIGRSLHKAMLAQAQHTAEGNGGSGR